jgi:hypothetical protein
MSPRRGLRPPHQCSAVPVPIRSVSNVGKLLKKLDFSSISARPTHQTNLEAQEAFLVSG